MQPHAVPPCSCQGCRLCTSAFNGTATLTPLRPEQVLQSCHWPCSWGSSTGTSCSRLCWDQGLRWLWAPPTAVLSTASISRMQLRNMAEPLQLWLCMLQKEDTSHCEAADVEYEELREQVLNGRAKPKPIGGVVTIVCAYVSLGCRHVRWVPMHGGQISVCLGRPHRKCTCTMHE